MSDIKLGMCDKRQYEHNGTHPQIVDWGQKLPPFPCVNWHEVVPDEELESVRSIAERTGIAEEITGAKWKKLLAIAWRISVEVHAFDLDKCGQPYLFHVARVAMAMDTPLEQICALLHDVVEHGGRSYALTIEREFPPEVIACVDALTRRVAERYIETYIPRVAENPLAVKVKLADLKSNMEPERLMMLPHEEMCRLLTRYGQAVKLLVMSKGKR